jgi:hypothetical protein
VEKYRLLVALLLALVVAAGAIAQPCATCTMHTNDTEETITGGVGASYSGAERAKKEALGNLEDILANSSHANVACEICPLSNLQCSRSLEEGLDVVVTTWVVLGQHFAQASVAPGGSFQICCAAC